MFYPDPGCLMFCLPGPNSLLATQTPCFARGLSMFTGYLISIISFVYWHAYCSTILKPVRLDWVFYYRAKGENHVFTEDSNKKSQIRAVR